MYVVLYAVLFYFFWEFIVQIFSISFVISLLWKELVIMTQHGHIEIPISNNEQVKPISYLEQVKYTRSFYVHEIFAKYFLFNFNLHEAHHAHPAIPAYKLAAIHLETLRKPTFFYWLYRAKRMQGVDYIFKTSKHTGELF